MNHIGEKQTFLLDGQYYHLARYTRGVLRRWYRWAKAEAGDPLAIAAAHLENFPCPDVLVRVADALAEDVYYCRDAAVEALHDTPEGVTELLRLLLEPAHPGADAAALVAALGPAEVVRLISRASGVPPLDLNAVFDRTFEDAGLKTAQPARLEGSDWIALDHKLFEQFQLLPQQVDEMTLPELQALFAGDSSVSLEVAVQREQWMKRLTPEQKLGFAYRKWGTI